MMLRDSSTTSWIEGDLRLSGIDQRMIVLLKAIADTGSISQAARACGLSYKGAWQIIERASQNARKALVSTATGGSQGGGACLTETGRGLLELYVSLETQHRQFLAQLNQKLADDPDVRLLLHSLAVKTNAENQLFGKAVEIYSGELEAEISIELPGEIIVKAVVSQTAAEKLNIKTGSDLVLLINGNDILVGADSGLTLDVSFNRLPCTVIRIQEDEVNAEVSALLANGSILTALITKQSAQRLNLKKDASAWFMFKPNAPVLGILEKPGF